MGPSFTHAILRTPAPNFAQGLTTGSQSPDYKKTLAQHAAYCEALKRCGLALTILEPDEKHPDSAFVEDTAVLAGDCAVLARPGAASREDEVAGIRPAIERHFRKVHEIRAPGTLDGGDVCEAGRHFFIGLSWRTNEEGAAQLAKVLEREGYSTSLVDIRGMRGVLHLKSWLAWVGDECLVVTRELAGREQFRKFERIEVVDNEKFAANCVLVNGRVLVPSGAPGLEKSLAKLGLEVATLDMSEFQKMDGGLSCLSLRF